MIKFRILFDSIKVSDTRQIEIFVYSLNFENYGICLPQYRMDNHSFYHAVQEGAATADDDNDTIKLCCIVGLSLIIMHLIMWFYQQTGYPSIAVT